MTSLTISAAASTKHFTMCTKIIEISSKFVVLIKSHTPLHPSRLLKMACKNLRKIGFLEEFFITFFARSFLLTVRASMIDLTWRYGENVFERE